MFESKIPPACLVISGHPWSFALCVQYVVDTNPAIFGTTRSAARAGDRIVNSVMGKEDGAAFQWLDDDRALIDKAFEAPAAGWCPTGLTRMLNGVEEPYVPPARMFLRYFDAIALPIEPAT